uniref:RNA helicase n=1 Tax=Acrobeloides nanus TaxID=290746 RepID=A0A914C4E4_9BILA
MTFERGSGFVVRGRGRGNFGGQCNDFGDQDNGFNVGRGGGRGNFRGRGGFAEEDSFSSGRGGSRGQSNFGDQDSGFGGGRGGFRGQSNFNDQDSGFSGGRGGYRGQSNNFDDQDSGFSGGRGGGRGGFRSQSNFNDQGSDFGGGRGGYRGQSNNFGDQDSGFGGGRGGSRGGFRGQSNFGDQDNGFGGGRGGGRGGFRGQSNFGDQDGGFGGGRGGFRGQSNFDDQDGGFGGGRGGSRGGFRGQSSFDDQDSGFGGGRGGGRGGFRGQSSFDEQDSGFGGGRGGFRGQSNFGDQGSSFGGGRGGSRGGFRGQSSFDDQDSGFGGGRGGFRGQSNFGDQGSGFGGGRGGGRGGFRGQSSFDDQDSGFSGGYGRGRGGFRGQSNFNNQDSGFSGGGACFNCGKEGHISAECDATRVDEDGNERNRNHIPEIRAIEDLYLEDKQHEELYRHVVEEDEEICVTGAAGEEILAKLDTWKDADFEEQLYKNITERSGYTRPRKIQAHTIPLIIQGRDVLGHAETGSGKTAAFMLPIISKIMKLKAEVDAEPSSPFAIIIGPTRELVLQIYEQGRKFADLTGVKVAKAYGQYNVAQNARELREGCDILCATPGRLKMFILKGDILVKNLKFLVLDEADRLLDQSFMEELRCISEVHGFPDKNSRQTLMFSATFEQQVQNMGKYFLKDDFVLVSNKKYVSANSRVQQNFVEVYKQDKNEKLREILSAEMEEAKKIDPQNPKIRRTLVFVQMKRHTKLLALFLTQAGIPATIINGDMSQDLRERALKEFRDYRTPVLIATDVCARGIDIKDLDHVVNFDLPHEATTYVHRIGRTGRLKEGTATSFFDPSGNDDMKIVRDLVQFVRDAGQEPVEFLVRASGGDNEANSGRLNGAAFENNEVKNEQTNFNSQPSTLLDANDEW